MQVLACASNWTPDASHAHTHTHTHTHTSANIQAVTHSPALHSHTQLRSAPHWNSMLLRMGLHASCLTHKRLAYTTLTFLCGLEMCAFSWLDFSHHTQPDSSKSIHKLPSNCQKWAVIGGEAAAENPGTRGKTGRVHAHCCTLACTLVCVPSSCVSLCRHTDAKQTQREETRAHMQSQ